MDTVTRAKNICLSPSTEWAVIAEEQTPAASLIAGYVAPLAAIGAVAGIIGGSLVGISVPFGGTYRVPLTIGIASAVFTFVMAVVGVLILSFIINALAPTFGGQQNSSQALKVAVYSYTPAWIAGALHIVPLLGALGIVAALYGLYLLYLGLPRVMKCPDDKSIAYTAVVVVCAIVLAFVTTAVGAVVAGAGMMTSAALGGGGSLTGALGGGPIGATPRRASAEVQFDRNSPLGKLQALGDKLDASTKKIDAAQKAGNQEAAATAALEGFATLLGGGHRVDPINIDQLKPFVPESFAGLPRRSINAEKTGIAALMVSKARAEYGDGAQRNVSLEISDSGGASGLVTLAGWVNLQEEKQDENGEERTHKVDGRLVHEKMSKTGRNEFSIVLGDRFVVEAHGNGVTLAELKSAVGQLDLRRLESLKDAGVQ